MTSLRTTVLLCLALPVPLVSTGCIIVASDDTDTDAASSEGTSGTTVADTDATDTTAGQDTTADGSTTAATTEGTETETETDTEGGEAQTWVLVGNTRGDDVVRIDGRTGQLDGTFVAMGAGGLLDPDTLLVRDGMLYVASGDTIEDSAILRFDAESGDFVDVFAEGGGMFRPYGFAFADDGNLYVSSFLSDELLRYDGTTGEFIDIFATGDGMPGGLNGPNAIAAGPDGALYISTQGSVAVDGSPTYPGLPSEVLRMELPSGDTTVFAAQPTPLRDSLGFVSMLGVAFGPDCDGGDCDLFTTDFAGGLRRHDGSTGELQWEVSTSYVEGAATGALDFGPDGEVFVPAFDSNDAEGPGVLLRYDSSNGDPLPGEGLDGAILFGPDAALVRPIGVTVIVEE